MLTDGEDNGSPGTNAAQVRAMLEHPGDWAAKCHFHTTVAITKCDSSVQFGEDTKRALDPIFRKPLEARLPHVILVCDIEEGFRPMSDVVITKPEPVPDTMFTILFRQIAQV